jgi:4-hydroxythreonine-4-phosphate dehydrogenase
VQPNFRYEIVKKPVKNFLTQVQIIDLGNCRITPGKPSASSGKISYDSIAGAYELVSNGFADAMITAPISKTAFNLAGISFPGHTELLAEWSGSNNYLMMFLSKRMKAALLTIHNPINKISGLITSQRLKNALEIIIQTMKRDLNIDNPKIAVLGLNPHAGESGLIGEEEEKVIIPVLKKFNLDNPFPPDAFFGSKKYLDYDIVLGMYHDQVLIPFKMINFSTGVNYTAGLNIVRTSPDHGTAYDIAWQNKADEGSMIQAFKYAKLISFNRARYGRD